MEQKTMDITNERDDMGSIYKITNKINGKVYIGQTSRPLKDRWNQHKNDIYKFDSAIYLAIRKYGIDNFTCEEIESCEDKDLNEKEIYWIKYYNSYINATNSNGYNMTLGGRGSRKVTDEELLYLWNKGLTVTKISQELGMQVNYVYTRIANIVPAEEITLRRYKTHEKQIKQLDLNNNLIKIWNSLTEAAKGVGGSPSNISAVCYGNRKSAYGYKWEYYKKGEINGTYRITEENY